jgi:hypothetical protein
MVSNLITALEVDALLFSILAGLLTISEDILLFFLHPMKDIVRINKIKKLYFIVISVIFLQN